MKRVGGCGWSLNAGHIGQDMAKGQVGQTHGRQIGRLADWQIGIGYKERLAGLVGLITASGDGMS